MRVVSLVSDAMIHRTLGSMELINPEWSPLVTGSRRALTWSWVRVNLAIEGFEEREVRKCVWLGSHLKESMERVRKSGYGKADNLADGAMVACD